MRIGLDGKLGHQTASGRRRWTLGRLINDLAIIMVAVPLSLKLLVPQERLPSIPQCGDTPENYTLILGMVLLAIPPVRWLLKVFNDTVLGCLDQHLPNSNRDPQPPPLDDF